MYVLLAIASALLYGVWKFGLGQYRGKVSAYAVVLVSASAAALIYFVFGALSQDLFFDKADILPGLLGGVCNLVGNTLIVVAFERGKMGVVSGVAATSTLVPLLYSLVIGEPLAGGAAFGICLMVIGLAAFYVPSMKSRGGETTSASSIALALVAALAWGVAIVIIDVGSRVSLTGTMLVSQVPQILFTGVALAVFLKSWGGLTATSTATIAGAGVALGMGNLAFFTAANEGDIGVVSLIGSLSPIVVALLAWGLLKQRMAKSEMAALVIVLAGTCLVVI